MSKREEMIAQLRKLFRAADYDIPLERWKLIPTPELEAYIQAIGFPQNAPERYRPACEMLRKIWARMDAADQKALDQTL